MKLFSWSSMFFLLSLSFFWGCGYWVWLQTIQSQQVQLYTQLGLQLERSEVLLEDWQRSYRLHLDYLRADLAHMTPATTDNVIYDPWQELDDKIQHAPWPDALLGYALLDDAGRAVRLSNSVAGQLFTITATDFSSNHQFLTPMVLPAQWIAPVHLELNNQHLLFWFDLAALKQKLQKAQQGVAGEILLVSGTAQLVSPSRYQQTLLARFGQTELRDDQSLKFQLKRPPEDLTRSSQKYDGSMAWPATVLSRLMTTTKQGQTPLFVPNYLGRPSVASWRWSDGWQAYLVVERDLNTLQQQRKTLRQYLLIGLSIVTAVLLLLFYLIQRGVRRQEEAMSLLTNGMVVQTNADSGRHDAEVAVQSAELPLTPSGSIDLLPVETEQNQLKIAQTLLQAWLSQPASADALREIAVSWLDKHNPEPLAPIYSQPAMLLSVQLTQLQQQLPATQLLLDLAADLPAWAILDVVALRDALAWLLHQRASQHGVSSVMVQATFTESNRLILEICDDGETLGAGYWIKVLHQDTEPRLWPLPLRQLQDAGGYVSVAQPQFSGNKLLLGMPLQVVKAAEQRSELHLIDGAALLLCPAGDAQQLYRRMLKQTGLALMPLDDAAQFMQWCSAQHNAQLDYLILDEAFINADQQIASQVFQVVRRYFPQLVLVVLVHQPATWQALQQSFQLRLISKPVLSVALQQALTSVSDAVFQPQARKVWLATIDAVDGWLQQQSLTQLGYAPELLLADQALPENELLMLPLEQVTHWQSQLRNHLVLWYTAQPLGLDALDESQLVWTQAQGLVVLSQRLFQLSDRLVADES